MDESRAGNVISPTTPADLRRDVATALSVTGSYAEIIERVGALAVPRLAPLCFIDLVESGILTRRATIVDPVLGLAGALMRAPHPDVGEGVAAALRGAAPVMYGRAWFPALAQADPDLAPFLAGSLRSISVLPLTFDNIPLGVLTFGQFDEVDALDTDLAGDFARLAAMAIANARLHEEARTASARADAARIRLSYVSRASSIFARSFERGPVLQRFVTSTTIDFAEAAQVYVLGTDGRDEHYSAGTHAAAEMRDLGKDAMREGRSRLAGDGHMLSTPLLTGGSVSGALTFSRAPEKPPYVIDDLTIAEDLAARTAMFVETSQAYDHQRRVAETLQEAFRPRDLPQIPGLTISAAYRPGTADIDVGGDWYDVVVMNDGAVAFVIGDVMGHGIEAAAVMAEIRSGLRAHLYARTRPGHCLGYVDTLLANSKASEMFATGVVAFYERAEHRLTLASAGHPLPYLRRADGTVRSLGTPATLLGLDAGARTESVHEVQSGDIVMFYTDGVVEDRSMPFDDGIALLEAALRHTNEPAEIIEALLGMSAASADDRTLLAFRVE